MRVEIYLHSSKEQNLETGARLGLTGDALTFFKYLAYEVKLEYDVDPKTGQGKLLKADGRELK
jgi:hypothetical protein